MAVTDMNLRLLGLLLAVFASAPAEVLIREDFSKFPDGWLTEPLGRRNAAIQEYHYLAGRGVELAPWENALCHLDAWVVGEEDGAHYLEQILKYNLPKQASPLFVTGDAEWRDYTVEGKVKPLLTSGMAGVVFRYHTNRHYYLFSLSGGDRARVSVRLPI